jgi:hypothetical protein
LNGLTAPGMLEPWGSHDHHDSVVKVRGVWDKKTRSRSAAWQAFVTGSHTSCLICRRRRDRRPRGSVAHSVRSVKSARRCTAGVRRSIRSLAAARNTIPLLPRSVKSPVACTGMGSHAGTQAGGGRRGAGSHEDTKTRRHEGAGGGRRETGSHEATKTRRHEEAGAAGITRNA